MPIENALYLLAAVVIVAGLNGRLRLHPFAAGLLATVAFGFAAGMSISLVGKAFGVGFANSLETTGIVIVAATLMTAALDAAGSASRLASKLGPRASSLIGAIAGLGSTPAAAYAALMPLLRVAEPGWSRSRQTSAVSLSLGLAASHGLLLPSPVAIAAMAIIGADWHSVVKFGLPATVVTVIVGHLFTRVAVRFLPEQAEATPATFARTAGRGVTAAVVAAAALIALLIIQSLGDIPSEPFGGGPARELLVGSGRPLMLLLAGIGLVLVITWNGLRAPLAEEGWIAKALAAAAPLVMTVAVGGALQKLAQDTGMAELLAEKLLPWQAGLLVPFLVAAVVKTLQGSSLVAAITAAGMIAPILTPLGLDSDSGHAFAVLAVGIGSMTLSHINDDFFWLVGGHARLRTPASLILIGVGTLVQALAGLATLALLKSLF